MHVFAGFESNQYVEMAINDILKYGVYMKKTLCLWRWRIKKNRESSLII